MMRKEPLTELDKSMLVTIILYGNCGGYHCGFCPISSTSICWSTDRRSRTMRVFVEEFGQEELFGILL